MRPVEKAVFAAVEAHNQTHPAAPLPRPARLLAVMFPTENVCCVSQQALVAEGFGKSLPAVRFCQASRQNNRHEQFL